MTAVNKVQLTGTAATISCIVSGLTRELEKVVWTKSDNTAITSGQDGYTIDEGTYDYEEHSQTTTLSVSADQNNQDAIYNCNIASHEHLDGADEHFDIYNSTTVRLNVFSKSFKNHFKL